MKNLNGLTEQEYDLVFNTDWNKGNESEMSSLQRAMIHDLFLKYLRHYTQRISEEENNTIVRGFVDWFFCKKDIFIIMERIRTIEKFELVRYEKPTNRNIEPKYVYSIQLEGIDEVLVFESVEKINEVLQGKKIKYHYGANNTEILNLDITD